MQYIPNDVWSGVIASLIAVFIVELYKCAREALVHRDLRRVLSFKQKTCSVITSVWSKSDHEFDYIAHFDAYAASYMLELCHRLNAETKLLFSSRSLETEGMGDMILIGGPLTNKHTRHYLNQFLPSLKIATNDEEERKSFEKIDVPWTDKEGTGFEIKNHSLPKTEYEEEVMLIKLSSDLLPGERTVIMVFGRSAPGTAAAAYYLWTNYRNVAKRFGKQSFCIGIRLPIGEGCRSSYGRVEDYSKELLPEEASGTSRGS